MASQPVRIPFPLKGITTNLGYESGDLQTTRDCVNVAPDSAAESRVRGGSRTGLTKRYATSVSGTPVFANRVSGGDDESVYEYMVVGVSDNIYVGESKATSVGYPVSYAESLTTLEGTLGIDDPADPAQDGKILQSDHATVPSSDGRNLLLYDFKATIQSNGVSAPYRGRVIINSTGGYHTGLGSGTVFNNVSDPDSDSDTVHVVYASNQLRLIDEEHVTDWTTEFDTGNDASDTFYVEVVNAAATPVNIESGTYKIASVNANYLVLEGAAAVSGAGATEEAVTYSIRRAVKDLDASVPSLGILNPTGGYVPLDADDLIAYRDRLVWADGRTWYMSKQGDAGNYDYAADPEDPARAIAGANSKAGEPATPINAMAVAGYDYLVFFSDAAIWIMRGDPAYGGQIYQASDVAGCVSRSAWCYGRSTEIYFLGKDGFYRMDPNAGPIVSLSKSVLPRSLRNANKDNFDTNLVYDPEDNTVLIFIVPKDGTAGTNYIYDIETASFWPMSLQSSDMQPLFAETFGGSPVRPRRALLVSRDGFLREVNGTTDDGEKIQSHVLFGPYPMSQIDNFDGFVTELSSVIDEDSAEVTIELYAENSAEETVRQATVAISPKFSAPLRSGRSITKRPRVRGNSFCVRIVGSGVWAFESMSAMISPAGRSRR